MAPRRLVHPSGLESRADLEEAFKSQLDAEPTFPFFSRLPDELKLRIFELAVQPRALVLPSRFKEDVYFLSNQTIRDIYKDMNLIPSLLRVSSISRQAVNHFYRPMFRNDLDELILNDFDDRLPSRTYYIANQGRCDAAVLVNLRDDIVFLEPCLVHCRAVHCCRRLFGIKDRLAVTRLGVQMETLDRPTLNDQIWGRLGQSWPNVRTLYMVRAWEERRYYPALPPLPCPSTTAPLEEDSEIDDEEEDTEMAEASDEPAEAAAKTSGGSVRAAREAVDDAFLNSEERRNQLPRDKFPLIVLDARKRDLEQNSWADAVDMDATEYREDTWQRGYQEWAVARASDDYASLSVQAAFKAWRAGKQESVSGEVKVPPVLEELVIVVMLRSRRPTPGQMIGSQYDGVLERFRESGRASDMIIG